MPERPELKAHFRFKKKTLKIIGLFWAQKLNFQYIVLELRSAVTLSLCYLYFVCIHFYVCISKASTKILKIELISIFNYHET